jgi:hypothetical protein
MGALAAGQSESGDIAGTMTSRARAAGAARIAAFVIWAAMSAYATAARAEPRTLVVLEYEIAADTEGCPDVEAFESNVKRQLGYDPFRPAADRRLAVRIARKESGFGGWIKWSDASGHWVGDRRLSSRHPECSEIAANVAFAVAVQIQLLAALAPTSPEPSPSTQNDNAPSPSTPQAGATPPAEPKEAATSAAPSPGGSAKERHGLRISAGLGPTLALGIAPHATGLGRIFVSGRIEPLSVELSVDGALPTDRVTGDGSGFSLTRFAAGAAACGHVGAFAACITGTLGRLAARGFGVDRPASPAGLFSQVGGRIVATHDLGDRYFVAARAEGLVMLSSWTVTLDDAAVWTTPRVGGLVGLDWGLHFF